MLFTFLPTPGTQLYLVNPTGINSFECFQRKEEFYWVCLKYILPYKLKVYSGLKSKLHDTSSVLAVTWNNKNDHFETSLESIFPKCCDNVVMLLSIKAYLKFSTSTRWELQFLGWMILVSQEDAITHSIREYWKNSNKIVIVYTLPSYLVPASLIITCFCLIGHKVLKVAAKIPASLWWKECL